jgi:hypothetical protein
VATGVVQALLLSSTPAPFTFFSWIIGLATLAAAVAPFAAYGGWPPKTATGAVNAAIGIAVWSLTLSVAHRALRSSEDVLASGPPAPVARRR